MSRLAAAFTVCTFSAVFLCSSVPAEAAASMNAACINISVPVTVQAGVRFIATAKMRNTGTVSWPKHRGFTLLGTSAEWEGVSFALPMAMVRTGETATIKATATAPTTSGTYDVAWTMAKNGKTFGQTCRKKIIVRGSVQSSSSSASSRSSVSSKGSGHGADVSIRTKEIQTGSVEKGAIVAVTFTVTNSGPETAVKEVVLSRLREIYDFAPEQSDPRCMVASFLNPSIQCDLGDMPVGASTDVTIATQSAGYACPDTVTVTTLLQSSTIDPKPLNSQDDVGVHLVCSSPQSQRTDLTFDVTYPTFISRKHGTMNVTIRNAGPAAASDVQLHVPVPANLAFVPEESPSSCSLKGTTVVCAVDAVNANQHTDLNIVFDAPVAQLYCRSSRMEGSMWLTTASQNTLPLTSTTLRLAIICPDGQQ